MRFAGSLVKELTIERLTLTTVESCTGGAIVNALTDISGSSEVIEGAFVTYSNAAKVALGVPAEVITDHGVYSPECAEAMAEVGLEKLDADICIAVTGSLGRADPANSDSRVGEVHLCVMWRDKKTTTTKLLVDDDDRRVTKRQVAETAFQVALDMLASNL